MSEQERGHNDAPVLLFVGAFGLGGWVMWSTFDRISGDLDIPTWVSISVTVLGLALGVAMLAYRRKLQSEENSATTPLTSSGIALALLGGVVATVSDDPKVEALSLWGGGVALVTFASGFLASRFFGQVGSRV